MFAHAQSNYATPYAITTLAGVAPGSADGAGTSARFDSPKCAALDSAGNLYVADSVSDTIRKVTQGGAVTTIAGSAGQSGSTDGTGSAARFHTPYGVAVDSSGNVFVSEVFNCTIRKVSPAGVVTTLAGTAGKPGGTDGTGTAASFSFPTGIAVDAAGDIYVADSGNSTIRMITPSGAVTTLAGSDGNFGSTDGTGGSARFNWPSAVAVDGSGNVYVTDQNNSTIREITPTVSNGATTWTVSTLAGLVDIQGTSDGTGTAARFSIPAGVTLDGAGNLYVADSGAETVRKVAPTVVSGVTTWVVSTLVGTPYQKGSLDGTGSAARFFGPTGIVVDNGGNLYVADSSNDAIRKITPAAVVTTLAGTASVGSSDGTGAAARFYDPVGVAVDGQGNVYVADDANDTIRKVTSAGAVTTIAGIAGEYGDGEGSPASATKIGSPYGVAVDGSGNVYFVDNITVQELTPAGLLTTIAGIANFSGRGDGPGRSATFNYPNGVAVDGAGNVYVADTQNCTIRMVTPTVAGGLTSWTVSTLAGSPGQLGSADGTGNAARFDFPNGVAVDGGGNVYVADSYNSTIRKITPTAANGSTSWVVTTLAGAAGQTGSADGTGSAARFDFPSNLAADSAGDVYVADQENDTIREITAAGVVTTLAGATGQAGSADGTGSAAQFYAPGGVAVDGAGNIYVADGENNTIRVGIPPSAGPSVQTQPQDQTISAGGTASFAVTAGGQQALTYQWQVSTNGGAAFTNLTDGNGISGSATATLKVTGAAAGLNGDEYQCIVTNNVKSVTTTPATLTVDSPPSLVTQPASEVVAAGNGAEFTVMAAGAPAPTYQWQVSTNGGAAFANLSDGNGISGSAAATLEVANTALSLTGYEYQCVVTNSQGSVTSTAAKLTVEALGNVGSYEFTTLAGPAVTASPGVNPTSDAVFSNPDGVAVDTSGNVFVADTMDSVILKIAPGGAVTTLAGASFNGKSDGTGADALFDYPQGVAVDGAGNCYVADSGNNEIRKITPAGVVTTLAGSAGQYGSADGIGSAARFSQPVAVAVDGTGNLFVADGEAIRKVTPSGAVTTVAGTAGDAGSTDGTGASALFSSPQGIAVDYEGNVYVADGANDTIRKIAPTTVGGVTSWKVTTLAGAAGQAGSVDGTGSTARFSLPGGIAADAGGNLYVADTANDTIRKVTAAGVVTTLGGSPGKTGFVDGPLGVALFSSPEGMAVDSAYNLYIVDSGNKTVRKAIPMASASAAAPAITTQPISETAIAGAAAFAVVAGGNPGLTYQWQVSTDGGLTFANLADGGFGQAFLTSIAGSSTSTLGVTNAKAALSGDEFQCIVTNSVGSLTTVPATMTVPSLAAPVIGTQPVSQSVNAGSDVVLSVAATANSPLYYQWSGQFAPIVGATGPTLSISNVQAANAGEYYVHVSDGNGGGVDSLEAFLTVNPAPTSSVIATQPASQTISAGSSVVFTVATNGSVSSSLRAASVGPLPDATLSATYQWQFNGNNLTDGNGISGSKGPQLLIQGATAANDGDYACVVTTGGQSVTSNTAGLQVETVSSPGGVSSISSRAFVGTGDNILIGGFYIVGDTSATVLVQALGPAIAASPYNVSGTLQRPALTIHQFQNNKDVVLCSDTGWGSSPVLLAAAASVYALPVLQPNSADSELLLTLPPGGYTAEITGADGGTGVALCGIYQVK